MQNTQSSQYQGNRRIQFFQAQNAYRAMVATLVLFVFLCFTPTIIGQVNEIPVPEFVPTFHSIGITWQPPNTTSNADDVVVRFRPQGIDAWFEGFPLWYSEIDEEYRGSLVHLMPNTTYDIQLTHVSQDIRITSTSTTLSEDFPIAHVIELSQLSNQTLDIEDSGTEDGYILYMPREGASATIDAQNEIDYNIRVDASYVIIRGLNLQNAAQHAIFLDDDAHHVVIENNDISAWGRIKYPDTNFGHDGDAAIYSEAEERVRNIIIQRNRIHHPRADTNSWGEERPDIDPSSAGWHPSGPQAIFMLNSGGGHIIRYNEIYSDEDHQFNDCIGGARNFSTMGFPNRDSDIYGNYISHCWDNSIESEGANENVRIWGNYTEQTYSAFATRDTSVGPIYIWRNVTGESRRYPEEVASSDEDPRGDFHKAGGQELGDHGVFVFHNTALQPVRNDRQFPLGVSVGLEGPMYNTTTRNNIFEIACLAEPCYSIIPNDGAENNDYNYDLLSHPISIDVNTPNSSIDRPIYSPASSFDYSTLTGYFALDTTSVGYDQGVIIPNFNSQYFNGSAPDVGAQEADTIPMQFGIRAYLNGEPYSVPFSGDS